MVIKALDRDKTMKKFGETSAIYDGKEKIAWQLTSLSNVRIHIEISENKPETSFYEIKEIRDNGEITLNIRCGKFKFSVHQIKEA